MKVEFRLRKLAAAAPVEALLLTSTRVEDLLALCARLGGDRLPRLHAVPDGFLLKLHAPAPGNWPRTVGLRRLADDLFLPADAALEPTLHADEAADLVRQRGLVFLPGGRVLAYHPDRPLTPAQLLRVGTVARRDWQPLPQSRPLADRLREVRLDVPEASADDVLNAGGTAIGTEAPRPPASGPGASAVGQAAFSTGKGLAWLGKALGIKGLSQLGAGLMRQALTLAPRLSEAVLGRQEAALRALLDKFKSGDLEQALRHALPLWGESRRGGVAGGSANLPHNSTSYSLSDLLGGGGGGGSTWYSSADLHAALMREYQKAAEQALRQGDYRRAAFIQGKLLGDFRLAAETLLRGGLAHDAAVLLLHKVGDTLAAARAFEAAGETDRALELYRQKGEHVMAGDLLRRLGEEDAAVAEYQVAAEQLVRQRGTAGRLAAGELLLTRAQRPDLALTHFQAGWAERPDMNAIACAVQLARQYAGQRDGAALVGLTAQADEFFAAPGEEVAAGQFYNELARLAERPALAAVRGDLRDRALLGLALKLRQRSAAEERPGRVPAQLLPPSSVWGPTLLRDAEVAFGGAVRAAPKLAAGRGISWVQTGLEVVQAVCFAPENGRVFLASAQGQLVSFRPEDGRVDVLPYTRALAVTALATVPRGDLLFVLTQSQPGEQHLHTYNARSTGGVWFAEHRASLSGPGYWGLAPLALSRGRGGWELGLFAGAGVAVMTDGLLRTECELSDGAEDLATAALLLDLGEEDRAITLLRFGSSLWCHTVRLGIGSVCSQLGWTPAAPADAVLTPAPVSWLHTEPSRLEAAAMVLSNDKCLLGWARLEVRGEELKVLRSLISSQPGYRAVALVRPGVLAAVRPAGVDWFRCDGACFRLTSHTRLLLGNAVACFVCRPTSELLIVCANGAIGRVPLPA